VAVLASRELNPYFAGGGSGMPTPAAEKAAAGGAVGKGDGGVAWLTKVKSTSKETIFRVLHHAGFTGYSNKLKLINYAYFFRHIWNKALVLCNVRKTFQILNTGSRYQ